MHEDMYEGSMIGFETFPYSEELTIQHANREGRSRALKLDVRVEPLRKAEVLAL
jgi:hypothetical protein